MLKSPEAEQQLILPGFEEVEEISLEKKPSQPRLGPERPLTGLHFLYCTLNPKFRGEVNRWLRNINFPLNEVLEEIEEEVVRLYLWPQEGNWLSQKEVALQMGWCKEAAESVSRGIKFSLLKIWRRKENGPQAIEILKPYWFLYKGLLGKGISTIPEILAIDDEETIRQICGGEFGLEVLKEALSRHEINWHPSVEFPQFSYQ